MTRSVVITGASRGLGLATAAHLYRRGWHVVAAMRKPEVGMAALQQLTGADAGDPRLTPVRLDLEDPDVIDQAAKDIEAAVGAPDALVHNAGLAVVGSVEELPAESWDQLFQTNLFGPVRLTKALLPSMRAAGRGRIVVVSSQGGIRGMPAISAYSSSKGALERWAESLSIEIAPFGLGVTILVAGSFKTDILEETTRFADPAGPYGELNENLERNGRRMLRIAAPPAKFGPAVERALDKTAPFSRHAVGIDAQLLLYGNRIMPAGVLQRVITLALGLPKPGSKRRTPSNRQQ